MINFSKRARHQIYSNPKVNYKRHGICWGLIYANELNCVPSELAELPELKLFQEEGVYEAMWIDYRKDCDMFQYTDEEKDNIRAVILLLCSEMTS